MIWQYPVFYLFWPNQRRLNERMTYKMAKASILNTTNDDATSSRGDSLFNPGNNGTTTERTISMDTVEDLTDISQDIAFHGDSKNWQIRIPKSKREIKQDKEQEEGNKPLELDNPLLESA